MGSYSKTYRATAAPSVGANWSNAGNIYDSDVNSYASRNKASTSATHINGFGINLPSNATVTSIDVWSKLYSASSKGYIYVYVYSDLMTSHGEEVVGTHVADGKSLPAQYVTNSYSAATLIAGLNNRGIHNGNLIEFLKNLRVRFVIGSTSYLSAAECRVYDNYVVVNYTIPDYTLTVNATTGGTVTGGGKYEVGKTATLTATASSGYRFVKWNDGNTSNPRTVTVSGNATYTATFERTTCTVTFRNQDGTVVKSTTMQAGAALGALPTVSRNGYTFAGWIPCAPAVKTDGSILDSCLYDGNTAYPLDKKYKYNNNLSLHIEAFMEDWLDIKNSTRQIMSCTEGGGWGLGYQANTNVDGAESHGFEVHTGSGYTGYDLKFGSNGVYANNKWHSFDAVFSNGVIEIFVDGVSKGSRTASGTTISYNADNTIFVGAEAGSNDSSPAGNYFKGLISNVFIANRGTRLVVETGTSSNTAVAESVDYYPIWRKNPPCEATFKNYDGTVLQTVTVENGSTPSYTGSTPTKAQDAQYTYAFSGWSPSLGAITADTTYTAQFTATKRKYTITTSVNPSGAGTVTGSGTYEYGTTKTLAATANDGYEFVEWSDGVKTASRSITVSGNATYTAVFEKITLPEISSVQITPNPCDAEQGFIISVEFT